MFQQLLNTTAIWLLCLLVYDVFLRMETYHRYNRLYLLASLLAGIFLPAITWQEGPGTYSATLGIPLQQVASVKQNIEIIVVTEAPAYDTSYILLVCYLIGCAFSLLMIAREAACLIKLYRKGASRREGKWTVIETNEAHGPFSFFNLIFVGSKEQYAEKEWEMLLAHERKHIARWHFVDILLIQIARVVFWFHPLVYLFQNRILMVHEYEADAAGAGNPSEYGAFLVEQVMLQGAPSITHSFNRSPIKNRIIMLTKNSSKRRMLKTLVAVPLALCCMFCFAKTAYSYKKGEGNIVVFKGNSFEFNGPVVDGVSKGKEVQISSVGKEKEKTETNTVYFFPAPVKMNGKTIHSSGEVTKEPVFRGKDKSLTNYIFSNTKSELTKLEDGEYFIHIAYPVIDEKGKLVYYDNQGVTAPGEKTIDTRIKRSIDARLAEVLDNAPAYAPAEVKGKPVTWYDAWAVELGYRVIVKDHKATLSYKQPR